MINDNLLSAIMDSMDCPIEFVDNNHIIRYMNKVAIEKHNKRGRYNLVGKSIFNCHNEKSKKIILAIYDELENGLEEKLVQQKYNRNIYMRAVRDEDGALIGYYERYERI